MEQIVSQKYGVEGAGISMQGGRPENQDDFGCMETPLGFLVMVCDGMGGGPGGKTASYIAKTTIMETLMQSSSTAAPADAIKMAVGKANDALEQKMQEVPLLDGMGSTAVMLLFSEHSAFVAHLGDSRCYQIRGEKVKFRTSDHSVVAELVRNKAMTEEQARTSPQSNIITRGLGSCTDHVAVIKEMPYRQGDRFVLCTDGVWGIMPHEDLLLRFTVKKDIGSLVKDLSTEIDQIGFSQGNHHDNHTMVVVEMKRDSILEEPMNKKTKILIAAGGVALAVSMVFNLASALQLSSDSQPNTLEQERDSLAIETYLFETALNERDAQIIRLMHKNEELELMVKNENDSKLNEIARLVHTIDSLNAKIDALSASLERNKKQDQERGRQQFRQPTPNIPRQKPEQLIDACVSKLTATANIKEMIMGNATHKVKVNVDACIALLETFNAKTDYKYNDDVTPVLTELKTDSRFSEYTNVRSNRNGQHTFFEVKEETKKEIKVVKGKLAELKKSVTEE
jgi:serine/threonine protein phosphatase PrpC